MTVGRTFSVQRPVGMGGCLSSRWPLSDLWYGKFVLLLWRKGFQGPECKWEVGKHIRIEGRKVGRSGWIWAVSQSLVPCPRVSGRLRL